MENLKFLLILMNYQHIFAQTQLNDTSCVDWSNKHVRPTEHLDYFNFSVLVVEFDNFNELNVKCEDLNFKSIIRLQFKSLTPNLLLPTNISFANLLQAFKLDESVVSMHNLKGFLLKKNSKFHFDNEIFLLELNDLKFEFYFNETQQVVTKETCLKEKFKFINFLDTAHSLMTGKGTLYTRPVCPYIFLRSQIKQLIFNQISNSLIFENRLSFIGLNENESVNLNSSTLTWLSIGVAYIDIDENMLNKYVFRNLVQFDVNGIILSIEERFFMNLKKIKLLSIQSDNLAVFFNKGLKWLD
jgi:hypothetical protein